ncbi:Protein CBR-TRF-1 [Caenorhabditis briggsae]|uniref:Protein CBR-TRF-1 n=1 Tax=Caenorhabditis briggsae TaxID=6238 RepID=A8XZK5_CAEBR|nr:Protein CBR-TRF-1 [Caenorhabditis briggsae]CAP38004.2 Protein CBR-TRF-1 [Caenorhabditis briggsae]
MAVNQSIMFKGGLPADCTCPICEQALREPMLLNCEHHYCKQCFEKEDRAPECALCQTIIQSELCKHDRAKHKQILSLPVVCTFESSGCQWSGQLGTLHDHLTECTFKSSLKCEKCGRQFAKADLDRHREKCELNRAMCSYCNKTIRDSDLERHLKTCPEVIISCPFQCGLSDRPRHEVLSKLTVPNAPMSTMFAHLSPMDAHLQGTYELMERDMVSFNDRQSRILSAADTCTEMFGPQLIWKIDKLQQRTNEAKSGADTTIFSNPFMSHRFGYKMMACACLFGDGTSAGKSISLYVLLLKGEFDPTLEWPFNRTIKISLLDQNPRPEDRVNITYVIDPRKLKANEKFLARPRGERNAAFGSQSFCSLAILQNYVKDDTIYVRIDVDRCETLPVSLKTRNEKERKQMMDSIRLKTPDVRAIHQVRPVTGQSQAVSGDLRV